MTSVTGIEGIESGSTIQRSSEVAAPAAFIEPLVDLDKVSTEPPAVTPYVEPTFAPASTPYVAPIVAATTLAAAAITPDNTAPVSAAPVQPPAQEPVQAPAMYWAEEPEFKPAPPPEPPAPHTKSLNDLPGMGNPSYSVPAFPQEPATTSKSWIKWALLAFLLLAVGGGALLAQKMGAFPGSSNVVGNTPSAVPAVPDKDKISETDKARADALVGPQGAGTTSVAPAVDSAAPAGQGGVITDPGPAVEAGSINVPYRPEPLPPPMPQVAPKPVVPETSSQTGPPTVMPPNRIPARPKPEPKGRPSLDDLLD